MTRAALTRIWVLIPILTLCVFGQDPVKQEPEVKANPPYALGSIVEDFTLNDLAGKARSLKELAKDKSFIVMDFWSPRCPYCVSHEARYVGLEKTYREKNVQFLHIASNRTENATPEGVAKLATAAAKDGVTFPALVDVGNVLADRFGAKVTPTVFILDAKTLKVCYTGAMTDDPASGTDVKKDYIDLALQALLQGKDPDPQTTKPEG